jgi:hypothetical protein
MRAARRSGLVVVYGRPALRNVDNRSPKGFTMLAARHASRTVLASCAVTVSILAGVTTGATSAAADETPTPKAVKPAPGMYGTADPTFDGVFRQSLALLAVDAAGAAAPKSAVDWLLGQQCEDGGFPAFRAEGKDCTAAKEDSNATGAAVQALAVVDGEHQQAVDKAVGWLKKHQSKDGGWPYNPGGATDANSTGLALAALKAAETDPAAVRKNGKSGLDALAGLQLGCDAKDGKLAANDLATVQATVGAAEKALPVAGTGKDLGKPAAVACPAPKKAGADRSEQSAAAYLAEKLAGGGNHLVALQPGAKKPAADIPTTADAVTALVATGHAGASKATLSWLRTNAPSWLSAQQKAAGGAPAATAKLILAVHAAGGDPKSFGGTDLLSDLQKTGPKDFAAAKKSEKPAAKKDESKKSEAKKDDDGGGFSTAWIIGCLVVLGIGLGFGVSLLRGRRNRG